ncbi:MAG: hypothetical protein M1834_002332 [Cirrosporium novae-zelandiae]|nr:MAG: hypothetical protein M1834_002332 [Cirrosporium novae-zelandiae]
MATFASSCSEPGGFFRPNLPSPAPSSVASTPGASILPTPRAHPLKGGSAKEASFINYVDSQLLVIQRRFAKKFSDDDETEDNAMRGYKSFSEVAKDIGTCLDVIWVSGTPSLQVSYLLSIALLAANYLPSFPFTPHRTFSLLHKIDTVFAALIQGKEPETGKPLPGLAGKKTAVSVTEKVRIKGLVEGTRVVVVACSQNDDVNEDAGDVENETDAEDTMDEMVDEMADESEASWEMLVARVYEQTIMALGEGLGNTENDSKKPDI